MCERVCVLPSKDKRREAERAAESVKRFEIAITLRNSVRSKKCPSVTNTLPFVFRGHVLSRHFQYCIVAAKKKFKNAIFVSLVC